MVLIVSCFILILYHDWNASRDEAMRRLERLMTVVEGSEFKKNKESRSFVYVYDLHKSSAHIDVIDKSFRDWENAHRSSPAYGSRRFARSSYVFPNPYTNVWINSAIQSKKVKIRYLSNLQTTQMLYNTLIHPTLINPRWIYRIYPISEYGFLVTPTKISFTC